MKFSKYLDDTCVPEWKLVYVNYKYLKKLIRSCTRREDEMFLSKLQIELDKIITFFSSQTSTIPGRYAFLEHCVQNDATTLNVQSTKRTKFLIREFYRYCSFLYNYQKLNRIAFAKIIKKYDKTFQTDLQQNSEVKFTNNQVFLDTIPRKYLEKIETTLLPQLFTFCLQNLPQAVGSIRNDYHSRSDNDPQLPKTLAVKYLQGPNAPKDEFAFFRVGMYIGLSLPLITLSVLKLIQDSLLSQVIWKHVLYIYGGLFTIVLSFFGFSFNIYMWRRYRINYMFIFELNIRKTITYKQFTEFSAISLFLWSFCLFLTINQVFGTFIHFQFIPLILILLYFVLLFLPFPVLYFSSRKWFIITVYHIFTPAFRKILFKDFFVADLFTSLTFFWTSIYVNICFYTNSSQTKLCTPSKSFITPVFISLPLIIRFLQCCRRFYDLRLHKDLYNAAKYAISIMTVFASAFSSIYVGGWTFSIWIISATMSSAYSYFWDIFHDWDVKGNNKIIDKKYLYIFCVLNLILRLNWILTINAFLLFDQMLLSFVFGCLEIFRRYIWALFRVELEHTNNIENYRAIKDIPVLQENNEEE